MCINKELIGFRKVNPTLDTNLCKEPLPLNRSGETPLEVASKAGHHEEISQVYEALGLPTTIQKALIDSSDKDSNGSDEDVSVFLSRLTYSAEYIGSISDFIIFTYCLQIDIENLKGEEVQQAKYNPESRIIRPGVPEFKKRKFNPEPEPANIKSSTPECKKRKVNPESIIISTPNSYAGAPASKQHAVATTPVSYGGTPLVGANHYAAGYPTYNRAPQGILSGQAPLTYPTQSIMPHPPQLEYPKQPLAYYPQGQQPLAYYHQGQQTLAYYPNQGEQPLAYYPHGHQPLAYYPQGQQPLAYYPQGQQPLAYYLQGHQPLEYYPQRQQPLEYYHQGQQPLAYYNQGQQPLAHQLQGKQPSSYEVDGQPYYPTPQRGESNHYLPQNPGQKPQ